MLSAVLLIIALSTVVNCATDLNGEVRTALKQALANVASTNARSATASGINSQRANAGSIQRQQTGDVMQEATRILVEKFGVGILSQLNNVNAAAILRDLQSQSTITNRQSMN